MRDRSEAREEAVSAALRRHYAIDVAALEPLPGGEDPSASVYRAEARRAGRPVYLVKVRTEAGSRGVAAAVSCHLHETGLQHVVAPIRSSWGSTTVEASELAITVYPFVEGRMGVEAGLLEHHWVALGREIDRLHSAVLPPELLRQLPRETYRPAELDVVRRIDRAVDDGRWSGGIAGELADFWAGRRTEIRDLVDRTEELGPRVERFGLPYVVCHADLHTWNVLIDDGGELWLVDWDEVILAPKERDLMFVVGGIGAGLVEPHETAWFMEGYGDTTVDPLALSYYRHAWAVQDIGSYGEEVFLQPSLGDEARSHAAGILMGLFNPGGIVELAR